MNTTRPYRFVFARLTTAGMLSAALLLNACSEEQPTDTTNQSARIEVTEEPSSSSVIGTDPQNITLTVGLGIIYRARIVSAGQAIAGARPTWRSTNPAVAAVNALPDSANIDGARAAIGALSVGNALVIASYNGLADTSRVTVIARVDSTPFNPPTAPGLFDATILVRGFIPGQDTANIGSTLLPGATVTLTRLPSVTGDVLAPGVTPVTVPTLFGALTVGSNSQVVFRNVPQSRFRVQVLPPTGTTWRATEFTVGPPQISTFGRIVTLTRP